MSKLVKRVVARYDDIMHVYLIPGFFGFVNLGDLQYFAHVTQELEKQLANMGIAASLHTVHTAPTASLRIRATRLLQSIRDTAAGDDAPIVLVGHSSGGLDARLLVTPDVSLPGFADIESIAQRVKGVITVSTPHYGTPLATFFSTLLGAQVLKIISLCTVYVVQFGRLPLSLMLKIGAYITRIDNYAGFDKSAVDNLFDLLLEDFSEERGRAVVDFLKDLSTDQALFSQLDPKGIDLFNASTTDRPTVRYGCVMTATDKPGLGTMRRVGLDPYNQASHLMFSTLNHICRYNAARFQADRTPQQDTVLKAGLGRVPSAGFNDGIVPTLSQLWGDIIHVVRGDHLDTIGHFSAPRHVPPHYDWYISGTQFSRSDFDRLWQKIAHYIHSLL